MFWRIRADRRGFAQFAGASRSPVHITDNNGPATDQRRRSGQPVLTGPRRPRCSHGNAHDVRYELARGRANHVHDLPGMIWTDAAMHGVTPFVNVEPVERDLQRDERFQLGGSRSRDLEVRRLSGTEANKVPILPQLAACVLVQSRRDSQFDVPR